MVEFHNRIAFTLAMQAFIMMSKDDTPAQNQQIVNESTHSIYMCWFHDNKTSVNFELFLYCFINSYMK